MYAIYVSMYAIGNPVRIEWREKKFQFPILIAVATGSTLLLPVDCWLAPWKQSKKIILTESIANCAKNKFN